MSTSKSIAFAAPYRSSTFNSNQSLLTGLNGVVSGGAVTTSGSTVTIQPLTFIQNGLQVTSDISLSATLPAGLTAPYAVAVTVSGSVQNLAEVITPTFVKRPQDVSGNTVIIADYDGAEWVARPKIQIKEQILANQVRSLRQDFFGIAEGLNVTKPGSNLSVATGSLIDRQGLLFTKTLATSFTPVATDVDSLGRIDEVLYRRPDDDSNRSGTLQYITGQTYNGSDTVSILHQTQIGNAATVNTAGKTLVVPSTNQSLFLFKEDYGSRAKLQLRTSPDLMTSVVASVTIATNFTDFDAVLNPDGSIDVVYARGTGLFYQRVSIAGASVFAEVQIATQSVAISNPKIVSVKSDITYFLHIVYEAATSGGDHRLFYVRRSAANTTETASSLLVSLSAVITNPSLEKDDDDALLLLAYENSTSQRVYLRQYDASTATSSSVPTQLGTTLELQDDTYRISTTAVLATSGATNPKVKRAGNKDTYVFWRHNKGSSLYGIGVYTLRYLSTQGHKAVLQDLTVSGENIAAYDVDVDGMNVAHFLLNVDGNVVKSSLNLEAVTVLGTNGTLDTVAPSALSTKLNAKGSLVQTWSYASAGTQNNGTAKTVQFIGPGTFLASQAISSSEFVLLASDYAALTAVPAVGDSVTLASAGGDNGTYSWLSVRSFTITATNYVAVNTSGTFTSLPSGPTAQFLVQQPTNLYFAKTTSGISSNLRGFNVLHTDIWLAHYRMTDSTLAVSGPVMEENTAISRLYEFFNCFAGSGQISWNIVSANKLAAASAIKFYFLNRKSLYQIAAFPSGVTIAANQVAYVQIPDTDSAATLTLQISSFGDGILDRSRKNTVPLFWNIDGVLYTRFAPFRLAAAGETVILGDQLSQQFLDWAGAASSTPDATAHGYSSTTGAGLLQSDSLNTAIGKLDAAIASETLFANQDRNVKLVRGGNWSWGVVANQLAWDADAFIQVPGLLETRNKVPTASSPVTLTTDGQVAYVEINRSGSTPASLAISVAAIGALTLTNNTVIIARRIGTELLLGNGTVLLYAGQSMVLDSFPSASSTLSGIVNAIAQTFGGVKTFVAGLVASAYLALTRTDVASAATITALSSSTSYVKLTGSTVTQLQGIVAGVNGQTLTLNNASGQILTVKNQNAGASAANRILLPNGADMTVSPNASIEFIYDLAQSRWVIKSGSGTGGGGGSSIEWVEDTRSPVALVENSTSSLALRVYAYAGQQGFPQTLFTMVKVPSTYVAGSPINLRFTAYSPDTSGNFLMQTVSSLIRTGFDNITSTSNQQISSNPAITLSGGTVNVPQAITADLTDTSGMINGIAVSAGDLIIVELFRSISDTATSDVRVPVYGAEATFS